MQVGGGERGRGGGRRCAGPSVFVLLLVVQARRDFVRDSRLPLVGCPSLSTDDMT